MSADPSHDALHPISVEPTPARVRVWSVTPRRRHDRGSDARERLHAVVTLPRSDIDVSLLSRPTVHILPVQGRRACLDHHSGGTVEDAGGSTTSVRRRSGIPARGVSPRPSHGRSSTRRLRHGSTDSASRTSQARRRGLRRVDRSEARSRGSARRQTARITTVHYGRRVLPDGVLRRRRHRHRHRTGKATATPRRSSPL